MEYVYNECTLYDVLYDDGDLLDGGFTSVEEAKGYIDKYIAN